MMPRPMVDEWNTEKICELLNNTETFYLAARGCGTSWQLREYVAWLYGSGVKDDSLAWTKENVPDLDTVDWDEVLADVVSE